MPRDVPIRNAPGWKLGGTVSGLPAGHVSRERVKPPIHHKSSARARARGSNGRIYATARARARCRERRRPHRRAGCLALPPNTLQVVGNRPRFSMLTWMTSHNPLAPQECRISGQFRACWPQLRVWRRASRLPPKTRIRSVWRVRRGYRFRSSVLHLAHYPVHCEMCSGGLWRPRPLGFWRNELRPTAWLDSRPRRGGGNGARAFGGDGRLHTHRCGVSAGSVAAGLLYYLPPRCLLYLLVVLTQC